MSAQYRPYRDEESVDGMEATSWSDNEPGTIQIYEKTTEELPFNAVSKRVLWTQIALLITIGILGFFLGYFAPFHPIATNVLSLNGDLDLNSPDHLEWYHSCGLVHEDITVKEKLLENIDGRSILSLLETFNNTKRIPGSESDHDLARHVRDIFQVSGFDRVTSSNYTFKTMLPASSSVIKLLDKENKTLYSNIDNEHYPDDDRRPFLPLSQANETVISTNQILYVNRGAKEDYARLLNLGVAANETEGKVFVVRQSFYQTHEVVINAQDSGARAILMFPDPDVYGSSSAFPKSIRLPDDAGRSHPTAWSNYGDLASSNQSMQASFDPPKFNEKDSKVQIPVIPISFNMAQKILRGLSGIQAPNEWNCFDFTLYLGPGYREENNEDHRDKILIQFYNRETTIISTTITGTIVGSIEPDRYVLIGSRRDSLNRGLLDSVSGTAVMLEISRVFGLLLKEGWRPKRSIVFNSFGAESLNLIGSSNWLETHQRILHSRAVAYLNCDIVVTGNQSVAISASPLLYQVLYNATKQVPNPNKELFQPNHTTLYDSWKEKHSVSKKDVEDNKLTDPQLQKVLDDYESGEAKLTKGAMAENDQNEDDFGAPGSILHEFKKSATVKTRPKVRHLDLQSIYSPFLLYAGIPVVDVRYAGFIGSLSNSSLIDDTLPQIGTKYDTMLLVQQIDPHLKYHVAVAKTLAEILRDLSDSIFLPFNILDYAVTLKDSYSNFVAQYGKTFNQLNVELESLSEVIQDFMRAAIKFHHRQDLVNLKDALNVRRVNDQLMLLERAFLDSNGRPFGWDRKHIILTPNDGQDHKVGFPGLVDLLTQFENDPLDSDEFSIYVEVVKMHYKAVVYTISNAIKVLDEVHIL